jgi:hypothetical protein
LPLSLQRIDEREEVGFHKLMKAGRLFAIGVSLSSLCGCTPSSSVSPPAGWVQMDTGKFTFFVPPDVKYFPTMGIDSFVGEYKGESIYLNFDYGMYSNGLEDAGSGSNYISKIERIDGKKARIAAFDFPNYGIPFGYVVGIHFPEVAAKGIRLTIVASCKTKEDREAAATILRTIRFK